MIEIEGLPEGWKAVAYRVPKGNIEFVFIENVVREAKPQDKKCLIIEKIKPRRIVLEETEEKYLGCQTLHIDGTEIMIMTNKTWREVKETDIPLTNEDVNVKIGVSQRDGAEPKLSLSVDECKEAMRKLETFNVTDLSVKICGFLKENS